MVSGVRDDKIAVIRCPKITSTKLLPNVKYRTQVNLKSTLNQCNSVNLTIDIETSRDMRSDIGITAHSVQNVQLKKAMLACKRFRRSHTAVHIAEQYESVGNPLDLHGKSPAIITDNAANMVKAFNLPGMENLDDEDTEHDMTSEDGANTDVDPSLLSLLPTHYSCFIHTL